MRITVKKMMFVTVFIVLVTVITTGVMKHFGEKRHAETVAGKVEYTCPMHPFIIKDRPGACPICNMELVRKVSGQADPKDLNLQEHVYLSPAQQVMANLEVVSVMYKPLFKSIEAAGNINYDQSRQARVAAWVAGRIERLPANEVGMRVAMERPVAELFSPDMASAEEEYLGLYHTASQTERVQRLRDPGDALYRAKLRLIQLGFSDVQFRELEKRAKATVRVPVYPPMNGVITGKDVQEGQYVKAGDSLFSIADLNQVWGELDVYEDEFPYLKVGQQVTLISRSYPNREFGGRITYIYPFLNPKTRTNRIRVVIPNQQALLKPDMVVKAVIQLPLGTDLVVPAEAVVTTGDKNLVWIQVKPGVFVPREVKTGVRYRYDIQILSGLKKDDAVAANGAYLIDSEAQLKPGGRQVTGGQDTAPPSVSAPRNDVLEPVRHPAGSRDGMDMGDMDMTTLPSPPGVLHTMKKGK